MLKVGETMKKQLDKVFLVNKTETCKNDWIRLSIIRNVLLTSVGSIVLMLELSGVLEQTYIPTIIVTVIYFYSVIGFLCITLEISYRMNKYYKYRTILDKYGLKEEITEEELIKIQNELNSISEYVIFLIWLLNHLLYSVPLAGILLLIYHITYHF